MYLRSCLAIALVLALTGIASANYDCSYDSEFNLMGPDTSAGTTGLGRAARVGRGPDTDNWIYVVAEADQCPDAFPFEKIPSTEYQSTCPKGVQGCSPDNQCTQCDPSCGTYCQNQDDAQCGTDDCMNCPDGMTLTQVYGDGTGSCAAP